MKALLIYDSFFGNTEKIALAVGTVLGADVFKVQKVKPEQLAGLGLLIVGSPTRAFSPSPDIKSFMKKLPYNALQGVKVAAFDTRIAINDTGSKFLSFMVKLFGYADKPIAKALVKKGGTLVLATEGYYVKESEGPLKEGEIDRATEWANKILSAV